jgi:hypothetical protein
VRLPHCGKHAAQLIVSDELQASDLQCVTAAVAGVVGVCTHFADQQHTRMSLVARD